MIAYLFFPSPLFTILPVLGFGPPIKLQSLYRTLKMRYWAYRAPCLLYSCGGVYLTVKGIERIGTR